MVISSEGKVCKTGPEPTSAIRNPRWKHSSTSLSPAFERNWRRTKLAQDRGTDRVSSMQPSSSLDTCAWPVQGVLLARDKYCCADGTSICLWPRGEPAGTSGSVSTRRDAHVGATNARLIDQCPASFISSFSFSQRGWTASRPRSSVTMAAAITWAARALGCRSQGRRHDESMAINA